MKVWITTSSARNECVCVCVPVEFSLQMKRMSFMKALEMLCSYSVSPLLTHAHFPPGYTLSSYNTSPSCTNTQHSQIALMTSHHLQWTPASAAEHTRNACYNIPQIFICLLWQASCVWLFCLLIFCCVVDKKQCQTTHHLRINTTPCDRQIVSKSDNLCNLKEA